VEGDLVAVGVGEGERPTEGTVDRRGDDGVTVGDESVVDGLDVRGVEPDRGTDAGPRNGCEIGAGHDVALGYLLKEASSALRAAMEEVLRPLGMNVTRYSCLELLAQRPGLSNSELARGAFVTRQSMNVLLQALEREGYVTRPAEAPVGKVLPTQLTPRGRRLLEEATVAVRSVEVRMLAGLTEAEQSGAFRVLRSMIRSLRDGDHGS
jgi:DNA-binding MarR family transcriptional regulator